ncbi:unnamed protein product [Coregonus sp. 'balchen']|nr:unnamed protein product [Coregonus sp. 'balchen']
MVPRTQIKPTPEYIERYGTSPVWSDYRRNHKGGIPPQKTRKTCIVGVCQKQKKLLNQAIGAARDHGLLPFQVPQVDFSGEDYSNSHDAVGSTPPPPTMTPWYRWYYTIQPDETEVAKLPKRLPVRLWTQAVFPSVKSSLSLCTAASPEIPSDAAEAVEALARYKDRPWDYLESEEYIERYGTSPVWSDYRRNHKGGIPPQKTRKTCIRGDKICGNPCPICRDTNIIIHYQNVKLLQQFISPYTGILYDPTRTGVCQKQQKQLNQAIGAARDHGKFSLCN